jgi:hypothetical protein
MMADTAIAVNVVSLSRKVSHSLLGKALCIVERYSGLLACGSVDA